MPFERRGPSGLEPALHGAVVDRHAFRSGQPRIVEDPVNCEPVKESLAQLPAFLLLFGTCSVGADPKPQQAGGPDVDHRQGDVAETSDTAQPAISERCSMRSDFPSNRSRIIVSAIAFARSRAM